MNPDQPRRRGRPGRRAAERAAKLRREGEAASGASGGAGAAVVGGMRLNKLLASRGLGARRKCDALIQGGSVRVNGRIVKEPGTQVMPDRDRVEVHSRPIPGRAALRYLMLHKPVGVITTLDDPEGRPTVRTLLPPGPRVFPVGRLDTETSGLIIATNDGDLAHHLMHPRYGVRKLYRARLDRPPDSDQVRRLRSGVMYEPGRSSAPAEVRVRNAREERAEIEIALHEGGYRQVRRMCEAVGLHVERLHRPEYGPLKLGTLPRGACRELTPDEVRKLKAASARPVPRVSRGRSASDRAAGAGAPAPGAPPRKLGSEATPAGARGGAGRPRILRDRPLSRASSAIRGSRSPSALPPRAPAGAASPSGRRMAPARGGRPSAGAASPSGRRTAPVHGGRPTRRPASPGRSLGRQTAGGSKRGVRPGVGPRPTGGPKGRGAGAPRGSRISAFSPLGRRVAGSSAAPGRASRPGGGPRPGRSGGMSRAGQRTGSGGPARPAGPKGRAGRMGVGRPARGRPRGSSPKRRGTTY